MSGIGHHGANSDLPAALRSVASSIERGQPVVGSELRIALDGLSGLAARRLDPKDYRRSVLRWIWARHCPGVPRTKAAELISTMWASERPLKPTAGSVDELFQRLDTYGVRRVGIRTIIDDLDDDLDAGRG